MHHKTSRALGPVFGWIVLSCMLSFLGCGGSTNEPTNTPSPDASPNVTESDPTGVADPTEPAGDPTQADNESANASPETPAAHGSDSSAPGDNSPEADPAKTGDPKEPVEPMIELNAPERPKGGASKSESDDSGSGDDSSGGDSGEGNLGGGDTEAARKAKLEAEIAAFQVPPAWLADVQPKWSTDKPWKEGRQEIRRLLGLNDEQARREAIKLTWDYLQKKDIGDGHEYGMYMFLGNEPIWAIIAFREFVNRGDLEYPPYFGLNALASIYVQRGVHSEGEKQLKRGLGMSPPKAEWKEMRQAEMHDALGDLYAAWGKRDLAVANYESAIKLFPQAKPPYGRHLLPRRAKKVQSKLDLLVAGSLTGATLRDGSYRDKALGYSGDVNLTVTIRGGRIANIDVKHSEKIEQNACRIIPDRIIEQQSLSVDGVTGATVTKDAIVGGALRALKQAGLR